MSIINRTDIKTLPQQRMNGTKIREKSVEEIVDRFSSRTSDTIRGNSRRKKIKSTSRIKEILINHISNNIKEYFIVIILFLIGITIGAVFINNINENQSQEIQSYINNFITSIKGEYTIDTSQLLKSSLLDHLKLVICMWFIGSTVIGIPIVLGIVLFRGFCIGYTISAMLAVLGTQKGILFFLITTFLQNIIFIPILLALAVSGINLYKSIMKDKRKENIKLEIIRHTIYSILFFIILILASLVEAYISANLLTVCIDVF